MRIPVKLFLVPALLVLCSLESESIGLIHKYGLGHYYYATPVYLATRSKSVEKLLFLKLLAVKSTLLLATPSIAIGSLVAGKGAGLLAGKLGTLAVLHHLKKKRQHGHGWGWHFEHHHPILTRLLFKFTRHARPAWWRSKNHFRPTGWGWRPPVLTRHFHRGHRPVVHYGPHSHGHGHYHSSGGWGHHHHSGPHYSASEFHDHVGDDHHHAFSEHVGYESEHPEHYSSEYSHGEHEHVSPRVVRAPRPEDMRPLTDEEYYKGVMQFAAEPFKDLMGSIKDSWMKNKPKAIDELKAEASSNNHILDFPGLSAKESEIFLEQHFDNLKTSNPEEGMSLIRVLRQAYAQTLEDLGSGPREIPDFVPFPEDTNVNKLINSTDELAAAESSVVPSDSPPEEEEEQSLETAIQHIPKEVKLYFTLLSAFDNETCFEKLVCDIHTRVGEADENFTPYEKNVLEVFSMLQDMAKDTVPDATSARYLTAARNGENNLSSELCQEIYPLCHYSTNEIMDMGNSLENASEFTIPNYMLTNLRTVKSNSDDDAQDEEKMPQV